MSASWADAADLPSLTYPEHLFVTGSGTKRNMPAPAHRYPSTTEGHLFPSCHGNKLDSGPEKIRKRAEMTRVPSQLSISSSLR